MVAGEVRLCRVADPAVLDSRLPRLEADREATGLASVQARVQGMVWEMTEVYAEKAEGVVGHAL